MTRTAESTPSEHVNDSCGLTRWFQEIGSVCEAGTVVTMRGEYLDPGLGHKVVVHEDIGVSWQ